MKTNEIVNEFGNKFAFGGKLDSRISFSQVSEWLLKFLVSKEEYIETLKTIRSETEAGISDKVKLDNIHEITDTIIFENGDW